MYFKIGKSLRQIVEEAEKVANGDVKILLSEIETRVAKGEVDCMRRDAERTDFYHEHTKRGCIAVYINETLYSTYDGRALIRAVEACGYKMTNFSEANAIYDRWRFSRVKKD